MIRRSFLARLGSASAAALAAGPLAGCGGPSYQTRFRLTVEIDTPEGVKSGSSVIEINYRDDTKTWAPVTAQRLQVSMKGEAVFVDLGAGKHVIALLAAGPTAQGDLDEIVRISFGSLPLEEYGRYQSMGSREVPPAGHPTLVTFADLADPASAKVVYATGRDVRLIPTAPGSTSGSYKDFGPLTIDRFAETFGPGYALKGVFIQMTTDPITRGIEGKVIGLKNIDEWNRKVGMWADSTRATPASASNIPSVGSMAFIRKN
jgi:hypothetical protein